MAKIIGHGAPTIKTAGVLGQEYFDVDAKVTYTCVNVKHLSGELLGDFDGEYEWAVVGGGASSWNDLENKPFGTNLTCIFEHTEVNCNEYKPEDSVKGGSCYYTNPMIPTTNDGITFGENYAPRYYTVIFDGVKYEHLGTQLDTYWAASIGDDSEDSYYQHISYNPTVPFLISTSTSNNAYTTVIAKTEGVHTIEVYREDIVVLDSDFLPKAEAVADPAGETVTAEEFTALLTSLRDAGYLKS